jgi:BirA family biotin operon repressor/biotin-[acetyl-CoA-carboxylase] ligase
MTPFLARRERFASVGSTNDVVRTWLGEGSPEVCLAIADEQTAGRGRDGRRWVAPPDAALLLSLGFRPMWLGPADAWRLAAIASLAMAEAADDAASLPAGTVRLKWPNDLVIMLGAPGGVAVRKLAGVLGETEGLGTHDPRVVVGLGVNADWAAADFPPDLAATMTSLREAGDGRRIETARLLDGFLERLEPRVEALRSGRFDGAAWADRQLTTGRTINLLTPDGDETVRALGVDGTTGALVVDDPASIAGERRVLVGEVRHVRLAQPVQAKV